MNCLICFLVAVAMRSAFSSFGSISMHFLALTRDFLFFFFGFSFSAVKFLEEFRVSRALYNARVLDCPKHPDRRDGYRRVHPSARKCQVTQSTLRWCFFHSKA